MSGFAVFKRTLTITSIIFLAWGFCRPHQASLAYTLTQTQTGKPVRWQYGQKFYLAGNPSNQSGLDFDLIWKSIVGALQQWKQASSGQFNFDYWQGTNPKVYTPSQKQDGLNSIFFASQSGKPTDPNVIGYTQVWYNSENGNILEADIVLNDRDYHLTDSPLDTTSSEGSNPKKVFLKNVITHEIGHAIGLSHSNSINSSMLYVEFSEQHRLGCDDWIGTRHLYPSNPSGWGALKGTLLDPAGEPLKGAVVTALSKSRGLPIASTLTNARGFFEFASLESGTYFFMIEPYQGTPASIPSNLRTREDRPVCGNKNFPKNFIVDSDTNSLKPYSVFEGQYTDTGVIQLQCTELAESSLNPSQIAPQAFVDRVEVGTKKRYTFFASGKFKINSIAYLLFSPIRISLSVASEEGASSISAKVSSRYSARSSGFKIDDDSLSGEAFGPVTVEVEAHKLDAKSFPSPAIWPGTVPYFALIYSDERDPITASLPNNARCDPGLDYQDYQSPAGDPITFSTSTSTRDHLGFCGTAEASEFKSRETPSAPVGSVLGWFFPFLVAIVCQLFLRNRSAKLKA